MPSSLSSLQRIVVFPLAFTAFFCLPFLGAAQPPAPGGVAGPRVWYTSAVEGGEPAAWVDRLTTPAGDGAADTVAGRMLNFHPAPVLSGAKDALRLTLRGTDLAQSTFFTVHQPADTLSEKIVWSAGAPGAPPLVLTTHRFADLVDVEYRNFVGLRKDLPGIKTYYQHKATDDEPPPAEQVLLIGAPPAAPDLPVQPYHGILPEVIVYDRVLSPSERTRVESYLALKYGLTLAANVPYLDAAGEVIWDASKNRSFHQRIGGIGRDDAGAFLQKQSTSSYQPGFPAIGIDRIAATNAANRSPLPDHAFLIWGDDGAAPTLGPEKPGRPHRIGRTWLMTRSGRGSELPTAVQFDLGRLAADRRPGETYWLIIDRSGTGRFPAGQVDYFPASDLTGRDVALFRDIRWDEDGSGSDQFSIAVGSPFSGISWLEEPACDPPAPGRMTIGAAGGQPPYRFILQGSQQEWSWESSTRAALETIDELAAGAYRLTIRDAAGAVFIDSLFLSNTDGPVSGLVSQHTLSAGQPLVLAVPASLSGAGVRCSWEGPEGLSVYDPRLEVNSPGVYRLTMDRAGCRSQQTIVVDGAPAGPFRKVALYPNPARAGRPFNLALTLERPGEVVLTIQDASGRRIRQHRLEADDYHQFQAALKTAGAYLISLQAGGERQTLSLVVE